MNSGPYFSQRSTQGLNGACAGSGQGAVTMGARRGHSSYQEDLGILSPPGGAWRRPAPRSWWLMVAAGSAKAGKNSVPYSFPCRQSYLKTLAESLALFLSNRPRVLG